MNDSKEDSRAAKLAAKHAKDAQVAKEMNETLRQILKDVREGSSSSSSSLEARKKDAAERIKKIENWDWRVAAAATTAVQMELAREAKQAVWKQAYEAKSVGIQVTPAARSVGTQTEDESSSSSFLGWFFPFRK